MRFLSLFAFLILAFVPISFAQEQGPVPGHVIEVVKPITPVDQYNRHIYYGWPTVAVDKNDQLFVVASGGRDDHVCPFGRVDFIRSHNAGETWTWPQTAVDGPIDDRDVGIVITPKGTIILTTFTSLVYADTLKGAKANREAGKPNFSETKYHNWLAAHERVSEQERQKSLGVYAVRSIDNGATWSSPIDTIVNSPHGPTVLNDGRLLYVGKRMYTTDPEPSGVAESTDDGKTWKWIAEIPVRKGDSANYYHEWHAVQTASGKIIAQTRNHSPVNTLETLQSESLDGGKTWTAPKSIGVWGHPSHLLRLNDNRILMTYGHRRAPMGNQARISSDEGKTWSAPIIISGDGASGDLGYPSTAQMKDGTLITVWYEKVAEYPKCILRMAKWKLTDEK